MKLKKIKIKNYKSIFNPIEIDQFSKFNILVGPNNAGKTNILDAIEFFFNPEKPQLKKRDSEMILSLSGESKDLVVKEGKLQSNPDYINSLVRIDKNPSFELIATEKLPSFKSSHPKKYKKFSSALESNFQNIQISEELFRANVKTDHGKESLRRMGDGFKRLFVILFYLYHPTYEIILIDEPELHLHPSVIKKFLKILEKNNLQKQVVMTTHHPTLVQAKYLDKTWRVSRDADRSTSVYMFDEHSSLDVDRLVQEINDDNSAMLFADKVLLVEGVSDSILMRGLIDNFYPGKKDIKVIYSGGVGDIDLYEKVCDIFKIPYAVMIDGDMLDMYWNKKFGKDKNATDYKKRRLLEEKGIFVLNGDLEENYPKKYQKKDTKPLNALLASNKITEEDFSKMKELKKVVKNL